MVQGFKFVGLELFYAERAGAAASQAVIPSSS